MGISASFSLWAFCAPWRLWQYCPVDPARSIEWWHRGLSARTPRPTVAPADTSMTAEHKQTNSQSQGGRTEEERLVYNCQSGSICRRRQALRERVRMRAWTKRLLLLLHIFIIIFLLFISELLDFGKHTKKGPVLCSTAAVDGWATHHMQMWLQLRALPPQTTKSFKAPKSWAFRTTDRDRPAFHVSHHCVHQLTQTWLLTTSFKRTLSTFLITFSNTLKKKKKHTIPLMTQQATFLG